MRIPCQSLGRKQQIGGDLLLKWPAGRPYRGTSEMVDAVKSTPYAIGYVNLVQAKRAGLQIAALRNAAGLHVLPEPANAAAAFAGRRGGRLPSGRLGAFGGVSPTLRSGARSLGPLEYLCAWIGQIDGPVEQQRREFLQGAEGVMALVEADEDARALYCQKLQADAADPLEGLLTRVSRRGLADMASAWAAGEEGRLAAQRLLAELGTSQRPAVSLT